jgi:hypothetical protein
MEQRTASCTELLVACGEIELKKPKVFSTLEQGDWAMKDCTPKPKAKYQPPRLVSYGDLTEMTHTSHSVIHASDGTKGNNKS